MKTLLLSCILGLVATVSSNAASINFDTGSGLGHMFVTSGGARLAIGSLVRMGTLSTPGDANSFVEFARTTINNTGGASTFTGFLRDGVTIATPAEADAIKGKQIFLYVYNAQGVAAGVVPTTLEKGLFSSTEWALPAGFDSAATTTFNVKLGAVQGGTPPVVTVAGPDGSFRVGTIAAGAGSNSNGSIYTLAIPEASTSLLAALAGFALLGRRKRA